MSSSNGLQHKSGRLKATNAIIDVRSLGFEPHTVKVFNVTNLATVERFPGLGDSANPERNKKTVAAGTVTTLATGGVTILAADSAGNPGFRIPVLADINDTTTEDLAWEAWGGPEPVNP
ncbi:hypothetical protein LCGC14_0562810 [marine sediment metagenome]|uniref:Uncharacterized protein n=1 Tax=marine sediment metagenome TaxID=412755 RepID=A0A0F9RLG5_9ZZZZ